MWGEDCKAPGGSKQPTRENIAVSGKGDRDLIVGALSQIDPLLQVGFPNHLSAVEPIGGIEVESVVEGDPADVVPPCGLGRGSPDLVGGGFNTSESSSRDRSYGQVRFEGLGKSPPFGEMRGGRLCVNNPGRAIQPDQDTHVGELGIRIELLDCPPWASFSAAEHEVAVLQEVQSHWRDLEKGLTAQRVEHQYNTKQQGERTHAKARRGAIKTDSQIDVPAVLAAAAGRSKPVLFEIRFAALLKPTNDSESGKY